MQGTKEFGRGPGFRIKRIGRSAASGSCLVHLVRFFLVLAAPLGLDLSGNQERESGLWVENHNGLLWSANGRRHLLPFG